MQKNMTYLQYANNINLAQQIIAEETTSCGYWYTQVRWNTSNFLEKPDKC